MPRARTLGTPPGSGPTPPDVREPNPEHREDEQGEERGEEERAAKAAGDGGLDRRLQLALEGPELLDRRPARVAADAGEGRLEVREAALRGGGVDLDELGPELALEGVGDRRRGDGAADA